MELSKLHDGFVVEDVLTIKAQVQVIRYLFLYVYALQFLCSKCLSLSQAYFTLHNRMCFLHRNI